MPLSAPRLLVGESVGSSAVSSGGGGGEEVLEAREQRWSSPALRCLRG